MVVSTSSVPCPPAASAADTRGAAEVILPEVAEVAHLSKRLIETGVVRIRKQVQESEQTFAPTLHREEIQIERVPIHREVTEMPEVRTEGDVTIIPVVEEMLVKVLVLTEEIRIRKVATDTQAAPTHVTLRREQVVIDRSAAEPKS